MNHETEQVEGTKPETQERVSCGNLVQKPLGFGQGSETAGILLVMNWGFSSSGVVVQKIPTLAWLAFCQASTGSLNAIPFPRAP